MSAWCLGNHMLAPEVADHFFSREDAAILPDGGPKLPEIAIFCTFLTTCEWGGGAGCAWISRGAV